MHIDTFIRTPVGADLSRPPPIYRPSVADPIAGLFCYMPLSAFVCSMTMAILADKSALAAINRALRLVACLQLKFRSQAIDKAQKIIVRSRIWPACVSRF